MNLDLFNATVSAPGAVREQLSRLPASDLVMIDALLEAGYQLNAYEDPTVERARLYAAARTGFRWEWRRLFRGKRRLWLREIAGDDGYPLRTIDGKAFGFSHYEPRLERELRDGKRGLKTPAETDHQSAKRRHW